MPWYGQGTIQVAASGTTAIGLGTQFLGNVRVGDGIAIQGSASLHEVTGVTSNTQLSFSPPYAGTAGSGKAYRAVPVLGYDKDLSDAFNQLRLQFGDQLSNLQPWATAPTLDAAQTAFGMSASGKTVATGTPAQGRTALEIPAAIESGVRALAVGTVSQSAGVPTGAIIERGGNANGGYVKFADGTLICTAYLGLGNFDWTLNGIVQSFSYPSSFLNNNVPSGSISFTPSGSTQQWDRFDSVTFMSTSNSWQVVVRGDFAESVQSILFTAIGRWY